MSILHTEHQLDEVEGDRKVGDTCIVKCGKTLPNCSQGFCKLKIICGWEFMLTSGLPPSFFVLLVAQPFESAYGIAIPLKNHLKLQEKLNVFTQQLAS